MKKKCTKCGKVKNIDEYSKDNGYKDGHRGTCKDCKNTYKRERYQNSAVRAKILAYQREYLKERLKDPDFRARKNSKVRERLKDPDFRARKNSKERERRKNPAVREKEAAYRRERLKAPEYRAKIRAYYREYRREKVRAVMFIRLTNLSGALKDFERINKKKLCDLCDLCGRKKKDLRFEI